MDGEAAIIENQTLPLKECNVIEEKKVRLNREWAFWENYEPKDKNQKNLDYSLFLKNIFSFSDLISFWQFWNKYPGSTPSNIFYNGEYIRYFFREKYRIIAMNLFQSGIRPEWEDEKNKKGKVLTLEYLVSSDLDKFMDTVQKTWTTLMLSLIGENLFYSQYINGIRFIDKTQIGGGKRIMFRFEVWTNKNITDEELTSLKEYLGKNFGCGGISVKDIK